MNLFASLEAVRASFDESISFVSPASHEDVTGVALHRNSVLPWAIGWWAAASGKQVLLWTTGNDDISVFSKTFFDLLRCEKDYLRFTADEGAAEHCISGNRALFHERVFDWVDLHVAQ